MKDPTWAGVADSCDADSRVLDACLTATPRLQVLKNLNDKGSEEGTLKSLDACLRAHAGKVLPPHISRASLHFQCFKTLEDATAARQPGAPRNAICLTGQPSASGAAADLTDLLSTLKADLNALEPLAAAV